jgi:DNA mismatch endonuclease (patch repair protein)
MQKVIFVHGCFWHQHKHCIDGRVPRSHTEYWESKLSRNVQRDKAARTALRRAGWKSLTIWECETVDAQALRDRIVEFLSE